MSSVSTEELQAIQRCIDKVARGRPVAAACIYGSKAAGYARPDSDIDIIVVLENYSYRVKYAYVKESGIDVSALIVDRGALEKDAKGAQLGEFVAGRLLHVYEPIANPEFLARVEQDLKRRVILEELQETVKSAGPLASEISFPLEYLAFAKIKRRAAMYPNAAYSYVKTYTANDRNLKYAMEGYRRALSDIIVQDPGLLVISGETLRLSRDRIEFARGEPVLRLEKKLQRFGSYFIHSYAGRHMFHLAVKEAESKIRRHIKQKVEFPPFLSCPACTYWKIPEGVLVADRGDWVDKVAQRHGISDYSVKKRRLGNTISRTVLYELHHKNGELKIAAKDLAHTKAVKWAALSMWTAQKFRSDPLFRLGTIYRALRHLRTLGLLTPEIEAVALDCRVIATRFVEGRSLADVMRGALAGREGTELLAEAGRQMATVHSTGACFGNIKPKNVIVNDGLWFTDLEQFVFEGGDPAWDLAQFVSWGLKGTANATAAAKIASDFFSGYGDEKTISKLASKRHIETFYPVLSPQVARAIKNVVKSF
jgi:tRNA A-37 threonylcarbamoyl transferase component Bud32/predicted nucleotidyltransferase